MKQSNDQNSNEVMSYCNLTSCGQFFCVDYFGGKLQPWIYLWWIFFFCPKSSYINSSVHKLRLCFSEIFSRKYIISEIYHCFFFLFSVYKFHISLLLVTHTDLCAFEHIVSLLKMPLWNKRYSLILVGIIHILKKKMKYLNIWVKKWNIFRNWLWSTYFPSSSFSS